MMLCRVTAELMLTETTYLHHINFAITCRITISLKYKACDINTNRNHLRQPEKERLIKTLMTSA